MRPQMYSLPFFVLCGPQEGDLCGLQAYVCIGWAQPLEAGEELRSWRGVMSGISPYPPQCLCGQGVPPPVPALLSLCTP